MEATENFIEKNFPLGPHSEVTVFRNADKNHKEKWLQGGWEVVGAGKDTTKICVRNRELGAKKEISKERLLELQEFKEGSAVDILGSRGIIVETKRDGMYTISFRDASGAESSRITRGKDQLIEDQIAHWENRKNRADWPGERHKDDGKILEECDAEIEYWKGKLATVRRLMRMVTSETETEQ
jgi:hypothetical protein